MKEKTGLWARLPAVLAGVAWIGLLLITLIAVQRLGAMAAIDLFFGDFANPWRAQFNSDFLIHLLLFAGWIGWRTSGRALALLLAGLSIFFGGMFNLPYLAVALVRARGDMRRLLLGRHGA